MRQKRFYLRLAQVFGMPFALKENKPFDPLQIRLLCAQRQPVEPHDFPALLHEFELGITHQPFPWPMQPFSAGMISIHEPLNSLDSGALQALND
jgi:hypothetical protein